jgi:hypothetical protein
MDERRKEQRYPVRQDVFVWEFPDGEFHPAVVEDVSWSGMRLQSQHSLRHGGQIAVDLKGMIVCGTVQYCRPLEDRFTAGISINHVDDRIVEGVVSQLIRGESAERQPETATVPA